MRKLISAVCILNITIYLTGCVATSDGPAALNVKTEVSQHEVQFISANGIEFGYVDKGTGPLVLLLHGFPENAGTFDLIVSKLANEGFRAVAPFTRGYYPTSIPEDNDYCIKTLGEDVLALIEALGESEAIVVGHDWGGSAAYAAANINPEKISRIVTIASAHPSSIKININSIYKARHILLFQLRGISDWWVKANNFEYLDKLYKRWSPNWAAPVEQVNKFKLNLKREGRTAAALGYYRSLTNSNCDNEMLKNVTEVPTLLISGDADGAMERYRFERVANSFDGYTQQINVWDGGHFLHSEFPELIIKELISFFRMDIPEKTLEVDQSYTRWTSQTIKAD